MNKLIVLLLLLVPSVSHAWDLGELDYVGFDYKSYKSGGHNQLIQDSGLTNREADKYLGVHLDVSFLSIFYLKNVIHGTTDTPIDKVGSGQFRAVGWNYMLGVRLTSFLDVEYEHHSQHLLDYTGINHFPVEDSIGFKLKLYENHRERGRIW